MLKYIQFDNLDEKVSKLLSKLGLQPEHIYCDEDGDFKFRFDNKSGVEEGHHYYLAKSPIEESKKVVIKIQLDYPNQPDHIFISHKSFAKEQEFYRSTSGNLDFIPNYISSGRFEDLNWLTYEFVPGETLGLAHTTSLNISQSQITRLIQVLVELLNTNAPPGMELAVKDGAYFTEHLKKFFDVHAATLNRLVSPEQRQKLFSLNETFATIIDNERRYLVHGDFHPGNIILGADETSVTIIDWEQVHLGTPVLDVAKLWNRAWQSPWRDRLVTSAREHMPVQNFDDQFRYLALHLLLDELVFWSRLAERKDNNPLEELADQALAIHTKAFEYLIEGLPIKNLESEKQLTS